MTKAAVAKMEVAYAEGYKAFFWLLSEKDR